MKVWMLREDAATKDLDRSLHNVDKKKERVLTNREETMVFLKIGHDGLKIGKREAGREFPCLEAIVPK